MKKREQEKKRGGEQKLSLADDVHKQSALAWFQKRAVTTSFEGRMIPNLNEFFGCVRGPAADFFFLLRSFSPRSFLASFLSVPFFL